jgi:hypothetical protein
MLSPVLPLKHHQKIMLRFACADATRVGHFEVTSGRDDKSGRCPHSIHSERTENASGKSSRKYQWLMPRMATLKKENPVQIFREILKMTITMTDLSAGILPANIQTLVTQAATNAQVQALAGLPGPVWALASSPA